jgi:ATP-dependent RNA helicase DeaD
VCRELFEGTGIRSVAVYGGTAYGPQIDAFKKKVHVIVGTPGRIIDHLESGRVSFKRLRLLVLDEADEMLSMGFYQSIMRILSYVPEKRQTALFSATIPRGVASLAQRFTRDPEPITLSGDTLHVEEVDHVYDMADAMYKDRALLKIIEMENPEAALIFCNTKREVEYLGVFLQNFGYDGDYLSGDLTQKERDRVMKRIREGNLRFLVATDVAARGIDLSQLGMVILYSLPQAHEHYIHRAGRTGRAGHGGTAISLVSIIEEGELKRRAERYGIKLIRKEIPTEEEVEKRVAERLSVMLEEKYRGLSNLEKERLGRFIPLAKSMAENAESSEITAMLFDQFYQETLHKPLIPMEAAQIVKEKTPRRRREPSGRGSESGKRRASGSGRRPRGGRRRKS